VDGKVADAKKIAKTLPFIFPVDETFDVGVGTRTPIDDNDYQVPFRFTGKLAKLTVEAKLFSKRVPLEIQFCLTRDYFL